MENLTRKELQKRTGIPRSSLLWLLARLDIQPVAERKTAFLRPIYLYDESCIAKINEWLNAQLNRRNLIASGKVRCQGGCGGYFDKADTMGGYCERCYVRKDLWNLLTRKRPWANPIDKRLLALAFEVLADFSK